MVKCDKLSGHGGVVKELEDRILRDGKNLGGGILKVDSFVNHQVDPLLMDACGREFARLFASVQRDQGADGRDLRHCPGPDDRHPSRSAGCLCAQTKPITMPDQVYLTLAPSHTKGRMVELIVSPEYLANGEKVLIIDDFLASGQTILGLARLAEASGSKIVGIGALIEKSFEGGRDALKDIGCADPFAGVYYFNGRWIRLFSESRSEHMHLIAETSRQLADCTCVRLLRYLHSYHWLDICPYEFCHPCKTITRDGDIDGISSSQAILSRFMFCSCRRKSVASLKDFDSTDTTFLSDLYSTVQSLVDEFHLAAYRLIVNGGEYQDFPQLHFHLVSECQRPTRFDGERSSVSREIMDSIAILDFGSQYAQIIARRVREAQVYCELFPWDAPMQDILAISPKGFILSGGPKSVYEESAPHIQDFIFKTGLPILGICYGMQALTHALGGEVYPSSQP